ncbi:hypothetical protein ACIPUC_10690 [Streptomyces sp. LARHCF249]
MSNPQEPGARRSRKGGATPQEAGSLKAAQGGRKSAKGTHPQGTDKGQKGGGEGGAVPPEERTDHP